MEIISKNRLLMALDRYEKQMKGMSGEDVLRHIRMIINNETNLPLSSTIRPLVDETCETKCTFFLAAAERSNLDGDLTEEEYKKLQHEHCCNCPLDGLMW